MDVVLKWSHEEGSEDVILDWVYDVGSVDVVLAWFHEENRKMLSWIVCCH